ncbi:MAG: ABC transporter permease [Acidobacteriota bacterium]
MTTIDTLHQDVRGAVRGLAKHPGFAITALITLALGIGATSAIFTVVRSVILAPLPYADPDRRVMIWSRWISFDKTWVSTQEVADYRAFSKTMTGVAAWTTGQQNLTSDGEPIRIGVGFLTANTFEVLGTAPLMGRSFSAAEDRPNGPPVAVLSHALWHARYAGDPAVIGRKIMLNHVPVEVVGVMPQGFRLPTDYTVDAAEPTALWRPLQIDEQNLDRGSHSYFTAAVLAPGQNAASATDELRAITRRLTERGDYHADMQFSAFAVGLDEEVRGHLRTPMRLVMGAAAFLLLIGCVNVANLLLVRADVRVREMSVRTAMGATPARLVRQLFTEGLVLALAGAVVGLAFAAASLRVLVGLDPVGVPGLMSAELDGGVVVFALVLAVVTTVLFGLAPAWRTFRPHLVESLREGSHQATIGGRRQRLRGALVVIEVALAVVLVIGAGLMIRSLSALGRIDLGFAPQHVLTMRLALPTASYDTPEKVVMFYRQLLERLRALPAVEHAGVVRALPLATTIGDWGLDIEGFEESPGRNAKGDWQIVSDGAFEALGTRLVRGRWFGAADTTDGIPVAVINETMARIYWRDGEAVGGRLRVGNPQNPWVSVVGIVADERHNGVTGLVKEKFYVPHSQWHIATGGNLIRNVFLVLRTAGDPAALAGPVRAEVRQMDPSLPVANIRPMTEVVSSALATPRLTGFLLTTFAAIALVLAAVGIYGVLAYLVSRRTHEIGIRLAVGAGRTRVLSMILGQGLSLAAAGIVVGLLGAVGLTRGLRGLLYEIAPTDPLTFVAVAVMLLVVAGLATLVPARRAMRVSPVTALRAE